MDADTMHHALQHLPASCPSKPSVLVTHIAAERPKDNKDGDVCPDVGQGAADDLPCAPFRPRSRQHLDGQGAGVARAALQYGPACQVLCRLAATFLGSSLTPGHIN